MTDANFCLFVSKLELLMKISDSITVKTIQFPQVAAAQQLYHLIEKLPDWYDFGKISIIRDNCFDHDELL